MDKDKVGAFIDAVLAIIMTILVLELQQPKEMTWEAVLALSVHYFAYALSFFWLGTVWVNLHKLWQSIKLVSQRTIWVSMLLLFFSSLFPYVTKMVSENFNSLVAQLLYAAVVFAVTITFIPLTYSLVRDNKSVVSDAKGLVPSWIKIDLIVKIIGLVLTLLGIKAAFTFSVVLAMIYSICLELKEEKN